MTIPKIDIRHFVFVDFESGERTQLACWFRQLAESTLAPTKNAFLHKFELYNYARNVGMNTPRVTIRLLASITLVANGAGLMLMSALAVEADLQKPKTHRDESGQSAPRDFCARVVVVYNGAGERRPDEAAIEAIDANAGIKSFIEDSPILVPSIIFSSDPAMLNSRPVKELQATGSTTVLPASLPSVQRIFSKEYLGNLKTKIKASPGCADLLIKPGDDISSYVKFEILIASHSQDDYLREQGGLIDPQKHAFMGLPVWRTDSGKGSDFAYYADGTSVLTKELFQPLYDVFSKSVIHAVIESRLNVISWLERG